MIKKNLFSIIFLSLSISLLNSIMINSAIAQDTSGPPATPDTVFETSGEPLNDFIDSLAGSNPLGHVGRLDFKIYTNIPSVSGYLSSLNSNIARSRWGEITHDKENGIAFFRILTTSTPPEIDEQNLYNFANVTSSEILSSLRGNIKSKKIQATYTAKKKLPNGDILNVSAESLDADAHLVLKKGIRDSMGVALTGFEKITFYDPEITLTRANGTVEVLSSRKNRSLFQSQQEPNTLVLLAKFTKCPFNPINLDQYVPEGETLEGIFDSLTGSIE
jgi:hypothetical protein